MMKPLLATFAAVMLLAAAPDAGDRAAPEIRATVRPEKGTVGSLLDYKINITGRGLGSVSIVPPEKREFYLEPKDAKQKQAAQAAAQQGEEQAGDEQEDPSKYVPLYIIHSVKKEDRSEKSMTDIVVTMQISYYHPGTWQLPDIDIRGADGVSMGYKVPTVQIQAVNEKGEFQDIEPPLKLSGNYWRLAFLLLGLAAFGTAAFFLGRRAWALYLERKNAPVIIPPIVTFMDEIHRFGGGRLIDEGRTDEFVFGISMIFRSFLSAQFRFDATDMTTYEIEKKIRKVFPRGLYDGCAESIMRNFNLWDLSKFAEFAPTKDQLHASLEDTVSLARTIAGDTSGDTADGAPRV